MITKKFKSLSFKLTIWYMVILATIITIAGVFLYDRFKDSLTNDLEKKLNKIASYTYKTWWRKKGITWQNSIHKAEEQFRMCQPFIQVIQMPDQRRDRYRGNHRNKTWKFLYSDNISGDFLHLDQKIYFKSIKQGRDNPLYITVPAKPLSPYPLRTILYPAKSHEIIQVGLSLENTINAQRRLFIILILAGPLVLLFASIGGNFFIRRALLPVKSVVRTAKKISTENLSMRIESGGRKDEIGELVDTFNQMITRLDGSVQRIRQFSADVSHELRTPLTIIRGEIEVILRKDRDKKEYCEILRSILEETHQMENIINDLLLLSRVRSIHKKTVMEKFPLHEVLQKLYENFIPYAKENKIDIKLSEISPVTFTGKQTLIERMITNVINNAIRYTHAQGVINISLKKLEKETELSISDTGIGIPEEAIPSIFDRFYVVHKSRSKESGGTGLGLSIVKWIADNHNIRIQVQSQPDQGTTFTFLFPTD